MTTVYTPAFLLSWIIEEYMFLHGWINLKSRFVPLMFSAHLSETLAVYVRELDLPIILD